MARLTEKQKKAVPASKRGIPSKSGTGSYPMPDKAHARNAKSRVSQFGTPAQKKQVNARANKILGK